ncbi:crocetin glucosyltransferase 2-like [Panicum miliaceum]|uniref:Glycosyltransferase n=1 Tax=Panicum miliaceum TaxID=4540 RepID=A0A3L6RB83_PANMI|nr:crocetin glucosyltransferase 2-like [Panicum miliaceum]
MVNSDHQSLHILLLPFPVQGHINPLFQFGKRLASHKGVRCTLAATRFVASSTKPAPGSSSVHVAVFSDGCDGGGPDELGGPGGPYFERLESAGSETLDALLVSEAEEHGRPVHVVTCAVNALYTHAWAGRVPFRPAKEELAGLRGLPAQLEPGDLPSFLVDRSCPRSFREVVLNQFQGLDTAEAVLVNSFHELEPQESEYLASTWGAKTVGPTVPSAYLDNRLPDDVSYGIQLHTPMTAESKAWLDGHPVRSVVYVSFGSMVALEADQLAELAQGLHASGKPFLWVVRATETAKLPESFRGRARAARGLVVPWCPQLDVLAHPSVGCFVTHCGWNSAVEAIAAGVPMVVVPQWSDQPMNAMCVEDVWHVGVQARPETEATAVVGRGEVERCVRTVMEGETGAGFRRSALDWSRKAKKAVSEGGSSDINILEFISKFRSLQMN